MSKRQGLLAVIVTTISLVMPLASSAAEGMVKVKSAHRVEATADKLVNVVTGQGVNVFERINHAEGAEEAGMELRPTEVVIFGNPKVGTPLMQCAQSVAIDLPQKALIWEDADGQVWLAYNDPAYLKQRHGIEGCEQPLENLSRALEKFATLATQ